MTSFFGSGSENYFEPTHTCGPGCAHLLNDDGGAAGTAPKTLYASGLHNISSLDLRAILGYLNTPDGRSTLRWNMDEVLRLNPGINVTDFLKSEAGVGTGVTIGYYFPTTMPTVWGETGFKSVADNTVFKQLFIAELQKISNVTNIKFIEVDSPTANGGKVISAGLADLVSQGAAGFGYYPSAGYSWTGNNTTGTVTAVRYSELAGDVIFNTSTVESVLNSTSVGHQKEAGLNYLGHLIRHELGHALGLGHPFEGTYTLPESAQNYFYTHMGYTEANDILDVTMNANGTSVDGLKVDVNTLGILDILALQKLYGANTTYRSGDNTYTWAQNVAFREIVYDTGGVDTIDLSAQTMRSYIDLTGDKPSSINLRVTTEEIKINHPKTGFDWLPDNFTSYRGNGNLGIIGTIENVNAGSNNDRINGNAANNTINAGAGNDVVWTGAGTDTINLGTGNDRVVTGAGTNTVNGGSGWDIAGINAARADLTINFGKTATTVTSKAETSTFTSVEMFVLNNGEIVINGRKVGTFDESFYLENNPDVANAVRNGALSSGFDHYNTFGKNEGRLAVNAVNNPLYNEAFYLNANPDVASAVQSGALRTGYDHYVSYGKNEGRLASPFQFDKAFYLAKNVDVKNAGVDAEWHFNNYGWKEGRDPSAYFDTSAYLARHTDVAAAGINPHQHFLAWGLNEGRTAFVSDIGWEWNFG